MKRKPKKKPAPGNKPATPKKRRSKQVEYMGITFDSQTEYLYYLYLERHPEVKRIAIQPEYQIIDPYIAACKKCKGVGRIVSEKTGNLNKCGRCKAHGFLTKPGAMYTADFLVEYVDGYTEVVDVKGYTGNQTAFYIRKKLFEMRNGFELIIVKLNETKDGWIRE